MDGHEAREDLTALSIDQLTRRAELALDELAQRANPEAFEALLGMTTYVGSCISVSAQLLSSTVSWARIGELAGTSRQNAWARWSH